MRIAILSDVNSNPRRSVAVDVAARVIEGSDLSTRFDDQLREARGYRPSSDA